MFTSFLKRAGFVVPLLALIFTFQNCGKTGFSSLGNISATGIDSLSSASADHLTPHISPLSVNLSTGLDAVFEAHDPSALSTTTYQWSHQLGGVADGCQLKSTANSTQNVLNCPFEGTLKISLKIMDGALQRPVADFIGVVVGTMPVNSLSISFNILAGTGSGPWNLASKPMEVYVGQTLTIVNQDTVIHQMHTGGKPCAHGAPIPPGGSGNCVISADYSSVTSGGIYDHGAGVKAPFYLVAYDGTKLFTQNCAGCHTSIAKFQSVLGKPTVLRIQNSLLSVPQMKAVPALQALTPRQIEALAYVLSK